MREYNRRRHPGKWILLLVILAVAGGTLWLASSRELGPFEPEPGPADGYELAAWEWRSPQKISAEDLRPYMEFASSERIRTIYLDISSIIDINEVSDAAEKAGQQADFDASLRQFVQEAHRHGISVHGLAGSVQWSDPEYRYLPLEVMDYVGAYNAQSTLEERLDGIQFDIEFYNQDSFEDNKRKDLEEYLETAGRLAERMAGLRTDNPDLQLGFAVPYWFDNENGNLPTVTYASSHKPVGYHLMDILDASKNGYVALMDYRDTTDGKNGSIEQAENEVRYAGAEAKNVRVVIGQLTNETKPAFTTFYDEGRDKLYAALQQLQARFGGSAGYGGLAVHDLKSFEKLVED